MSSLCSTSRYVPADKNLSALFKPRPPHSGDKNLPALNKTKLSSHSAKKNLSALYSRALHSRPKPDKAVQRSRAKVFALSHGVNTERPLNTSYSPLDKSDDGNDDSDIDEQCQWGECKQRFDKRKAFVNVSLAPRIQSFIVHVAREHGPRAHLRAEHLPLARLRAQHETVQGAIHARRALSLAHEGEAAQVRCERVSALIDSCSSSSAARRHSLVWRI